MEKVTGTGIGETSMAMASSSEIARFGRNNEFSLRVAVSEEDRLACWRLVYSEYLRKGYVRVQDNEYRYSLHDALPDAATFMVETQGNLAGTVTVYPDSPLGLPADEIYQKELDGLRRAGRTPMEIGRLTIAPQHKNERSILLNLNDAPLLYARRCRKASDVVITVNPSHVKYYERALLFERMGGEKALGSVCEAPAVLLRLDMGLEMRARRWAHGGEGSNPGAATGTHTFYHHLAGAAEEHSRVEAMRRICRKPDDDFVGRHFVCARPLIPKLSSPLRYFFEQCYPGLGLQLGAQWQYFAYMMEPVGIAG